MMKPPVSTEVRSVSTEYQISKLPGRIKTLCIDWLEVFIVSIPRAVGTQ